MSAMRQPTSVAMPITRRAMANVRRMAKFMR
jgi:hypothetical protein